MPIWLDIAVGLIGGLGLFLFGIQMMASGMQKAAGDKLRRILEVLTSRPWLAAVTGVMVTFLIQSSSTTTVMVVGFANAGIMSLAQAAGTILGANVGTTLTAQIISFNIKDIALPAIGVGAFLNFFGRRRLHKYLGQTLLGFGLLFLGLITMSKGMSPLAEMESVTRVLISFSRIPLLGVLVGAVFTAMLQSSSAATGVIIALSLEDMLTLESALPLILGTNLGTCITVIFASIGANLVARRAALAHILFNAIGVIVFLLLLGPFAELVRETASSIPRQIANAHTLFNVFSTILLLPFFKYFISLIKTLVPGEEKEMSVGSRYLDKRMLRAPAAALAASRQELLRMGGIARDMLSDSIDVFIKNDAKKIPHVEQMEELLDDLEKEITVYLAELSQHSLTQQQSNTVTGLMFATNDMERIGDHAQNIMQLSLTKIEDKLPFSEAALQEIREMYEKVESMFANAMLAFEREDVEKAREVIREDDVIDYLEKKLRQRHIERINEKRCYPSSGVIYLDVLSNLERIADHATNIAEVVNGNI